MPRKYSTNCNYCGVYTTRFPRFCQRECFLRYRLEHREEFVLTQEQRDKIRAKRLVRNGMSKPEDKLGWHGRYNREWRKQHPDYYREYNKPRFVYSDEAKNNTAKS